MGMDTDRLLAIMVSAQLKLLKVVEDGLSIFNADQTKQSTYFMVADPMVALCAV